MSSGGFRSPDDPGAYLWSDGLDPARYLVARYRIAAVLPGHDAALGMAMEQSAATLRIQGYVSAAQLADWTIRVMGVRACAPDALHRNVRPYLLDTEVYVGDARAAASVSEVTLAVPLCLLAGKPAQLLNVLVGELPRLGFITGFQLVAVDFPAPFGPGPAFGRAGILSRAGVSEGPLLCRSMRPAVGLDMETMARLNRDVLLGGFHMVKDDELMVFQDQDVFADHLRCMLRARDEARQASGERKLYLASLICEPQELTRRWDLVCELGVDGVLVAPSIQGLGVLPHLARQAVMPILAHNTFADLLTRHPGWGVAEAVACDWFRQLGADWSVSPSNFGEPAHDADAACGWLDAAVGERHGLPAMMPILQGGKSPEGLSGYRRAVGGRDFTLIVASWVDRHPAGLQAAARIFRDSVGEMSG